MMVLLTDAEWESVRVTLRDELSKYLTLHTGVILDEPDYADVSERLTNAVARKLQIGC